MGNCVPGLHSQDVVELGGKPQFLCLPSLSFYPGCCCPWWSLEKPPFSTPHQGREVCSLRWPGEGLPGFQGCGLPGATPLKIIAHSSPIMLETAAPPSPSSRG